MYSTECIECVLVEDEEEDDDDDEDEEDKFIQCTELHTDSVAQAGISKNPPVCTQTPVSPPPHLQEAGEQEEVEEMLV